jgi:beta-lactamase superfamily II metal-dependent hydrolase
MIGRAASLALAMALALPTQGAAQAAAVPTLCPLPDSAGLLVRFLDVGQGDATLLSTGDGRHVLIDGGQNATLALRYLTAIGVDTIALIIISHHHYDHPPWTRRHGQNLASVGTVARFGEFRILFTGDAETRALRWWTSQGLIPAVSVVKIGHHGGRNGTTPELVAAARPRLAVVSVGAGNSYGHPDPDALALWSSAQAQVLRTDEQGTVTVRGCADGTFSLATSFSPMPAGTR